MATFRRRARSEEARQSAEHVLFVEGKGDSCIDPVVLGELLRGAISVKALGSSFHIRSAAEALHKHHPRYYFLIDRDHYDDAFVEACWATFPDPNTCNLLIWRRRELENYFLIPEYLVKSEYLAVSRDQLSQTILSHCRKLVFFDAANQVIVRIREALKENWIRQFQKASEVRTPEEAVAKLTALPELGARKRATSRLLSKTAITKLFSEILNELTGGERALEYGTGRWLELMRGKPVLPSVVSKCFRVSDAAGNVLQGPKSVSELAKDLVRKPMAEQPADFRELARVISDRVAAK